MAGIAPTPNAAGPSTDACLANDRFARIFEELLDAEVSENPEKLCEASRAGIPPLYRSTVYRYLLGIAFIDKSREMTLERMQEKDFEQLEQTFARIALSGGDRARRPIAKGIVMHPIHFHDSDGVPLIMRDDNIFANGYRSAEGHSTDSYTVWLKVHANFRYLPRFSGNHERRQRMESAWRALFVVYSGVKPDEVRNILDIALSFELVHDSARDIFFSVQSLYHILTHHGNMLQNAQFLQQQCGTFLMLFRATNFELYRHFVSEGVAVVDWLPGMLSTLLAGRLHEEDLLRLWDIYLADAFENMCFSLHPYVCLAILADMTEILIECEKSGIIERLRHIPRIRTGNIIHKAISLKESVYSKGLL